MPNNSFQNGSFPFDLSSITAQITATTDQFSTLNGQLANIGTQLQSTTNLLSSEAVNINTTVATELSNLTTLVNKNVVAAQNVNNTVGETWLTYTTNFFASLLPMFQVSLAQFNADISTSWQNNSSLVSS